MSESTSPDSISDSTIGALKREAFEIIHQRGGVGAGCEFTGSGDSGFVEDVGILDARGRTIGFDRRLDEIADELVCAEWSGWYDGDGGCGEIEFTSEGEVKISMNWYVEQTEPAGTVTY